jgi:hypothetical protein
VLFSLDPVDNQVTGQLRLQVDVAKQVQECLDDTAVVELLLQGLIASTAVMHEYHAAYQQQKQQRRHTPARHSSSSSSSQTQELQQQQDSMQSSKQRCVQTCCPFLPITENWCICCQVARPTWMQQQPLMQCVT